MGDELVEDPEDDSAGTTVATPQPQPESVVSASHIKAIQVEQADVRPGMNVLEISSGGYNAALRSLSARPVRLPQSTSTPTSLTALALA